MSINKAILLGNVGRDPEIRYVEGRTVASFTLATNEPSYTTPEGITVAERTEWHNIVVWDHAAEIAERYVRRGTRLFVEGKIRTRTWQDRNTIKRTVTEIVADNFEILSRQ